ncbi:MAG: DNA polymerase III subunit gamma/tau [Dehalococcoidales bacterium]|nr:DNA polymerase III subunit gamma/tau [Dehalococcoidales bacterium]
MVYNIAMTSQVFYRKWRPQTLGEVVGQEMVTRTLLNALASGRISHAYLFCGPRGTGKTSTGRILAKAVNCLTSGGKGEPCTTCNMCQEITGGRALDVIEVDAASNRGIDEIRDLREKVGYSPNQARYKVYIIDEVHMLTKEASNALLKTLEEPPPHAIFILATTEAHKVLPTILSRCQRFDFRRISQADVVNKLGSISQSEGIKIEPDGLRLIARVTTGSLRDAENLLQQLTTYYGAEISLQQVQNILGITGDWRAKEMVKHIINNDIAAGVTTINSVHNDGLDLSQFNREMMEYLRALLLIKTGSGDAVDLTVEDKKELADLAAKASLAQIVRAVKLFGQLDLGFDSHSTLPLELALVDCTMAPEEKPKVADKSEPKPPAKPASQPAAIVRPAPPKPQPKAAPPAKPAGVSEPAAKPVAVSAPAPKKAEAVFLTPLEVAGSEINWLKLNWKQLINSAPDGAGRSPAAALLRTARPRTIEDNTVTVAFKFPVHRDNMQKPDNQRVAEKLISGFLGRACRVSCVHEPEDNHLVEEALKSGFKKIEAEEK